MPTFFSTLETHFLPFPNPYRQDRSFTSMKWNSKYTGHEYGVRRSMDFLRKTRRCTGQEKEHSSGTPAFLGSRMSRGSVHEHAKSLQSCPILCYPVDCSSPGSSVHEILQFPPGKETGVGCHALLQGIFPTEGSNPHVSYPSCISRKVLYD